MPDVDGRTHARQNPSKDMVAEQVATSREELDAIVAAFSHV